MTDFPTYLYHKTEGPQLVHSAEEKKALGAGWQDKPFPKEEAAPEVGAAEKALAALEEEKRKLEGEIAKLKGEAANADAQKATAQAGARLFADASKGDVAIGDVRSGWTPPFTAQEKMVGDLHRPRPDVLPAAYDAPVEPQAGAVATVGEMPPVTGSANPARLPADGPREEPTPSISTQIDREHGQPTPSAVQPEMKPGGPVDGPKLATIATETNAGEPEAKKKGKPAS